MNLAGIADAGAALAQALVASAQDPADQIRIMLALAQSAPQNSFGNALRRMALIQMATACAAYQPSSYNDAVATRVLACAALDVEIYIAADGGEDDVYTTFRALRIAVAQDLRARGDPLPRLRHVTVPPLPAAVLAYRLYGDATREGEIVKRADPVNPLFMATELTLLDR